MFWSFRENAGGLNHMWKGLQRAIFRVPATKHFEALSKKSDKVRLVTDDENNPLKCKACGYAIVRMTYTDGWEVESCSAITAPDLIDNKAFEAWVEGVISSTRVKTEVR